MERLKELLTNLCRIIYRESDEDYVYIIQLLKMAGFTEKEVKKYLNIEGE